MAFACLGLGACALDMGEMSASEAAVETTGSIRKDPASLLPGDLGQEDWRRAKGALGIALDPQGSGAAVKWENPDSNTRGAFTPVAPPFVKADEICRTFLARVEYPTRTASLQGSACRVSGDDWDIREIKPFRRDNR